MADKMKKEAKTSAAKSDKKSDKKAKSGFFSKTAKKVSKFFKDLKGEAKKIVWNDKKTVLKSTGVVLAAVVIIGAGIWVVDYGLSGILRLIKDLRPEDAKAMIDAAVYSLGWF